MHDGTIRAVTHREALLADLQAQVEILVTLKVILVEATEAFEQCAFEHNGAGDIHFALARHAQFGDIRRITAIGRHVFAHRRDEV